MRLRETTVNVKQGLCTSGPGLRDRTKGKIGLQRMEQRGASTVQPGSTFGFFSEVSSMLLLVL